MSPWIRLSNSILCHYCESMTLWPHSSVLGSFIFFLWCFNNRIFPLGCPSDMEICCERHSTATVWYYGTHWLVFTMQISFFFCFFLHFKLFWKVSVIRPRLQSSALFSFPHHPFFFYHHPNNCCMFPTSIQTKAKQPFNRPVMSQPEVTPALRDCATCSSADGTVTVATCCSCHVRSQLPEAGMEG